jgi:pimeloyl-ACP methyl ester carboxylesterase
MKSVVANGITLAYEERGSRDNQTLILVRGLGTQLIDWPDRFIQEIVNSGMHVLWFDNRDVGLSQKFDEAGVPDLKAIAAGDYRTLAYSLEEMANDIIALMDCLDIDRAHVAGISMGGMIVQLLAAEYPARLLSMASIMSSSGRPGLPGPTESAAKSLQGPSGPRSREQAITDIADGLLITGSPGYPESEETRKDIATRRYDRNYNPSGVARQMAAVVANGSRVEQLKQISVPGLVVHGEDDPLIPLVAGIDTADCIPGCKLVKIPGMGHNVPLALADKLAEILVTHCLAD